MTEKKEKQFLCNRKKNRSANLKIKQAYILKQKYISYCQLKLQPSKYMLLTVSQHSVRKPTHHFNMYKTTCHMTKTTISLHHLAIQKKINCTFNEDVVSRKFTK